MITVWDHGRDETKSDGRKFTQQEAAFYDKAMLLYAEESFDAFAGDVTSWTLRAQNEGNPNICQAKIEIESVPHLYIAESKTVREASDG